MNDIDQDLRRARPEHDGPSEATVHQHRAMVEKLMGAEERPSPVTSISGRPAAPVVLASEGERRRRFSLLGAAAALVVVLGGAVIAGTVAGRGPDDVSVATGDVDDGPSTTAVAAVSVTTAAPATTAAPTTTTAKIARTADITDATRLATDIVPEGLDLVMAADHSDLGAPTWESASVLYTTADVRSPEPGVHGLLITTSAAGHGLLVGEIIDIDGIEASVINKDAAGTEIDLEFELGETQVQLTGLGDMALDHVIEIAQDIIARQGEEILRPTLEWSADAGAPELVARFTDTFGLWQGGAVPLSGEPDGTSALYQNDVSERSLHVLSSPVNGDPFAWYGWLHPDTVEDIDLDGFPAIAFSPRPDTDVIRTVIAGRVVDVVGFGLDDGETLEAARSLRAAGDDEWHVGLEGGH